MQKKVGLVSLGCAKNLVDSEIMLGSLQKNNFTIVSHPEDADILIVNTCGFIGPAKEESIETILEMVEHKNQGSCRVVIVTGCLSKRYKQELLEEIPEIDALLGTNEMDRIPEVIARVMQGEKVVEVTEKAFWYDDPDIDRVLATQGGSAYLKIAEGCSHQCSFCAIPNIRGKYRSRSVAAITAEAEQLVQRGVKELVLIAQDTTYYGMDNGRGSLAELLRELSRLDVTWIRVLYTFPNRLDNELIQLIAENERLVKYVDLPLQHAAKTILKRMRRPGDYNSLLELVKTLKQQIPGVFLRSSFIVGLPGETDDEFQELLKFLKAARFNHVGTFKFCPEEGTEAYSMLEQIPEEVKEQRYREAMEVQQQISRQLNEELVGRVLDVLVTGPSPESDLVWMGRHQGQAPDVDGVVYFANKRPEIGELVKVKITEAHAYDLVGEIVEEEDNS